MHSQDFNLQLISSVKRCRHEKTWTLRQDALEMGIAGPNLHWTVSNDSRKMAVRGHFWLHSQRPVLILQIMAPEKWNCSFSCFWDPLLKDTESLPAWCCMLFSAVGSVMCLLRTKLPCNKYFLRLSVCQGATTETQTWPCLQSLPHQGNATVQCYTTCVLRHRKWAEKWTGQSDWGMIFR